MNIGILHELSSLSLRSLAASLRDGVLSSGVTASALQQIAGARSGELRACLELLSQNRMAAPHIAILAEAMADSRDRAADPASLFDLVLSGPDVPGIPTADTAAVMRTLIEDAREEVILVGFVVYNCRPLFERLAERMRAEPALQVTFCLDISRGYTDTSLSSEIVHRFALEFRRKHWPWQDVTPKLYYDPRSLSESRTNRSSLHAKCIIVDRRVALITSANFTEAAQQRNIEAGVIVRHKLFTERVAGYFEALIATGHLAPCPLP
ncbi:MAG TPA: DISARM system phospholipase D-like protein DrmC [Blastocatellia bacterium]|nr:DISARM system phospholipase D-like protein DrmC [Blastocatellia bacterium]